MTEIVKSAQFPMVENMSAAPLDPFIAELGVMSMVELAGSYFALRRAQKAMEGAARNISASGGSAHVLDGLLTECDDRLVAVAERVRELGTPRTETNLRTQVLSDYAVVAGEAL